MLGLLQKNISICCKMHCPSLKSVFENNNHSKKVSCDSFHILDCTSSNLSRCKVFVSLSTLSLLYLEAQSSIHSLIKVLGVTDLYYNQPMFFIDYKNFLSVQNSTNKVL